MTKLFPEIGIKASSKLSKENLYFTIKQMKRRLNRLLDEVETEVILGDMPEEQKIKLVRILGKAVRRMEQVEDMMLAEKKVNEG